MDGGIRRGSDIFKALALGARAVLVGRPLFWGLAVDGENGVLSVLEMLRDELDATMGMCGRTTIDSIDMSTLTTVSPLLALFPQPESFR
jgi:4-hydroxymandelate oxidase